MKWMAALGWIALLFAWPSRADAQAIQLDKETAEDANTDALMAWKLTLTPMAEARPALKYSLWPRFAERTPGNATPHYYRALLMQAQLPDTVSQEYRERSEHWLGNRLDDAARQEMRTWLGYHASVLKELEIATYREQIDLDLRLRDLEGLEAIEFLLPDAQETRTLARMLQVKARLEIDEGRFEDAIGTLRIGYRLAEFAAKTPTLINDLVGIAIASLMTSELTRFVAEPDAPNMYWAIAALPTPLIELREALEWESGVPAQIFPFLKDAETVERTPEEWRRLIMEAYMKLHKLTGDYLGKPGPLTEIAATALMMKGYPAAKQTLIEEGMSPEAVEAMPVGQVVAIHTARGYRLIYDEMFKWTLLPAEQVHDRWSESERRLRERNYFGADGIPQDILPIAFILLPAIQQAWYAPIRLERQLAALRLVEAIRMHAKSHGGRLPASLNEIEEAVVPRDPLFGQPFDYRIEGSTAVVETRARPGMERRHDTYRYTLGIKQ